MSCMRYCRVSSYRRSIFSCSPSLSVLARSQTGYTLSQFQQVVRRVDPSFSANFPGGGQRWNHVILGMGVPHILGLLERGCQKLEMPILLCHRHPLLLSPSGKVVELGAGLPSSCTTLPAFYGQNEISAGGPPR